MRDYITNKEIEQAKAMLRERGIGWINGRYHEPTSEHDAAILQELDAMGMIHSFIAYRPWETKNEWITDQYFRDHLQKIGAKRLQALIDRAIDKVEFLAYAGTDGERCHYNAIAWKNL